MQTEDKLFPIGEILTQSTDRKTEQAAPKLPTMADFHEDAMDAAKQCFGATNTFVHKNSWKVAATAATLGLFTGLMIRRK
jgi:ElaB/YqjD/DUF883 family membrane-anchored ribosome-binding protein